MIVAVSLVHVTKAHSDAYSGGMSRWEECERDAKCGYDFCKKADNDDGYECVKCMRSRDCITRALMTQKSPTKPICNSNNVCVACENAGQCDVGAECMPNGLCSFC